MYHYGASAHDITHDNTRRAGFALDALLTYWRRGHGAEELGTALSDLLCDLHHLSDAIGVDFGVLTARGGRHHDAELYGLL